MIGSADEDDVEILLLEHLAIVAEGARSFLGGLAGGDELGGFGEHALIDVAERDDFDGRDLDEAKEVGLAVPTGADEADAECFLIGAGDVSAEGRERESGCAGTKKFAAIHESSRAWSRIDATRGLESTCRWEDCQRRRVRRP